MTVRVVTVVGGKERERFVLEVATDRHMTSLNMSKDELEGLKKSIDAKLGR